MCVCIHLGPTGGQSAAESGVTYSSGDHNAAEVESMDTSTSGMQGSPGNNIATKSIVNHPNSEVDETLKNCSEGNKGSEGSTSPMNWKKQGFGVIETILWFWFEKNKVTDAIHICACIYLYMQIRSHDGKPQIEGLALFYMVLLSCTSLLYWTTNHWKRPLK
jgi:hypothetical protein